jgi:iron-sulfur cluster assembly accessory protein
MSFLRRLRGAPASPTLPEPAPLSDPAPAPDAETDVDDLEEGVVPPPRLLLTPAAVERIREMMEEADVVEEGGLRIRASTGAGCSAPLRFNLVLETSPRDDDVTLEAQGIRLLMDPTSAWMLDGLRVDWVADPEMGEGFAFRHPRGLGGRAC